MDRPRSTVACTVLRSGGPQPRIHASPPQPPTRGREGPFWTAAISSKNQTQTTVNRSYLFKSKADLQSHLISVHLPVFYAASDLSHLKPTEVTQASGSPCDCVLNGS